MNDNASMRQCGRPASGWYCAVCRRRHRVGQRFIRGRVKVDVLFPDGIGDRAREVLPGVRSVEVPGGTQALQRSDSIEVRVGPRAGAVHRPSLLGAILVKARIVGVDDLPDAQREDIAFLLSLVTDP